jgi:hypothetical protein
MQGIWGHARGVLRYRFARFGRVWARETFSQHNPPKKTKKEQVPINLHSLFVSFRSMIKKDSFWT